MIASSDPSADTHLLPTSPLALERAALRGSEGTLLWLGRGAHDDARIELAQPAETRRVGQRGNAHETARAAGHVIRGRKSDGDMTAP